MLTSNIVLALSFYKNLKQFFPFVKLEIITPYFAIYYSLLQIGTSGYRVLWQILKTDSRMCRKSPLVTKETV